MRVVIVHNQYRSSLPSGENLTVLADAERLRERGHAVRLALRSSDDLVAAPAVRKLMAAGSMVYSVSAALEIASIIDEFEPDVIHMHNLFPLWSPAVSRIAHARGVKRVQVLHNYRHSCLSANHMRNSERCLTCVGERFAVRGLVHGCYHGRMQSAAAFATRAVNWNVLNSADRYLAVSESVRRKAIENGVRASTVFVKPNHILDRGITATTPGSGFLYAGRLDHEKGISLLLSAYGDYRARGGSLELVIAGDGPLAGEVQRSESLDGGVKYLGRLTQEQLTSEILASRCVVAPSIWEEPFGRTVLEAWSCGRAVLATNLGGPGDLLSEGGGWLVPPISADLANAMFKCQDADEAQALGREGNIIFKRAYSGCGTVEAYENCWASMGLRP